MTSPAVSALRLQAAEMRAKGLSAAARKAVYLSLYVEWDQAMQQLMLDCEAEMLHRQADALETEHMSNAVARAGG